MFEPVHLHPRAICLTGELRSSGMGLLKCHRAARCGSGHAYRSLGLGSVAENMFPIDKLTEFLMAPLETFQLCITFINH